MQEEWPQKYRMRPVHRSVGKETAAKAWEIESRSVFTRAESGYPCIHLSWLGWVSVAALGPSLVVESGDCSLVMACRLRIEVASLVAAEHGV